MFSRVAIIPARSGSQRIYQKNRCLFHGKPIIAYSILTALKSGLFDTVVVSTDDVGIAEIALIYGANVFMRDEEHSADQVGTQDVARYVLDQLKKDGKDFDLACVIYATAPMLSVGDLKRGLVAVEDDEAVFSFSVGTEPLSDAGQFYWGESEAFGVVPIISEGTAMIPIDSNRVCDINVQSDWNRAEDMYAELVRSHSICD